MCCLMCTRHSLPCVSTPQSSINEHHGEVTKQQRHCRIELCKEDGTVLRSIVLDECKGAPHEFRGVYRGGLLRTLQSGVPPDCIQYNSSVQSIVQDDDGESLV